MTDLKNNRPISLPSQICKLFTRIITKKLGQNYNQIEEGSKANSKYKPMDDFFGSLRSLRHQRYIHHIEALRQFRYDFINHITK